MNVENISIEKPQHKIKLDKIMAFPRSMKARLSA
jgi:hypothetical protein